MVTVGYERQGRVMQRLQLCMVGASAEAATPADLGWRGTRLRVSDLPPGTVDAGFKISRSNSGDLTSLNQSLKVPVHLLRQLPARHEQP